jgi:GGDEF domain-containing protein
VRRRFSGLALAVFAAPVWLALAWAASASGSPRASFLVAGAAVVFYLAQLAVSERSSRRQVEEQVGRVREEVRLRLLAEEEVRFSRRYLQTRLAEEIRRSRRYGIDLTFLVMRTNPDAAGADKAKTTADVLVTIARLLRSEDVLGDLGSFTYGVILPHTNLSRSCAVMRRLGAALAGYSPEFGVVQLGTGVETPGRMITLALRDLHARALQRRKAAFWNESPNVV